MPFLPFAGKNSIVEALLGVQFAQPIITPVAQNFDALKAEFEGEFPKFEQLHQVSLTLGPPPTSFSHLPIPASQPTVAGFVAARLKPDGQPARVLRATGNGASAHFLVYDHWHDTKIEALRYFNRCFDILMIPTEENPVTGIQLTFIDRFTFDGAVSEAKLSGLAKAESKYLPHNLLQSSGVWQFSSFWPDQRADFRTDHNLSVQGVVEKNAAVVITHIQGRSLEKTSFLSSLANMIEDGGLPRHLDDMHNANASMLKSMLSDEMLKQIGLA